MHYDFLDGDNGTQSIQSKDLSNALLSTLTTQELLQHVDLSELPEAELGLSDNLLIGTSDGNKKRDVYNAFYDMINIYDTQNYKKRSIWRGKDLGSYVTDRQWESIANGTFDEMFVGDFWLDNNGIYWRIVDIDYWLYKGPSPSFLKTHHLVIMPDANLYNGKMNDTDVTTGGYMGSKMFSSGLIEASNMVNTMFGSDHILRYNEMLTNAVDSSGVPSGSIWCEITVCLPSMPMVFGSYVWEQMNNNIQPKKYSISNNMLAGMRLNPGLYIGGENRITYFLREPADASTFFATSGTGHITLTRSSTESGVRPVFGIKG